MKKLAIKAENISKQYRIGEIGTGTLSHDLNRLWYRIRGKEDPYLTIGEINDRVNKGTSKYVWSLKDVCFEIEQGDSVGIIGKNGAGKSTLLKILSKVTKPTTGSIKVNGRIASLLEVGTGFNPEMTGRENIYLNGAILGMRRSEIRRKLEEIIDFSGVERYIDTPVKRYSSGMYVRLAFAVAAHLDSEILIVDEVLAVGDAEFQKKCLGKMGQISKGEGRTVLFVSHNMGAIKNLCDKALLLKNGLLLNQGEVSPIIDKYFYSDNKNESANRVFESIPHFSHFTSWKISGSKDSDFSVYSDDTIQVEFIFRSFENFQNVELGLVIRNSEGQIILGCNSRDFGGDYFSIDKGEHKFIFSIYLPIKYGEYELDVAIVTEQRIIDQWVSPTLLILKNRFESVLSEKWTGILTTRTVFKHELA